ncbi:toxin [Pseudomonas sp. C1C7]|uniref:membrane-targeted effector domain-containing toxin n=1 Tax=Pseudomonas sp. C1C7 TaxID=2735272 RepID=UPI0015869584|nr:membrane-targeted effector domain-containing toxin [Pseudomonas sp. C1C7]NUT73679.1 toxin [Pseudomonas sp. C1C7]
MSTSAAAPSFEEIKGYLNQIGHYLLTTESRLLPAVEPTAEQRYLKRINDHLKSFQIAFIRKSRSHYQALENVDLQKPAGKQLLTKLKATLNTHLLDMDLREPIDAKPAKSFLLYDAGLTAIEHEARLAVQDRLLHPQAGKMLENIGLGPVFRPGLYALQFGYQDHSVEWAGAFVATQKNSPLASDLQDRQDLGQVLLFTPSRGIESFDSLSELNAHLLNIMDSPTGRDELMRLLPMRYQALTVAGIWPLTLTPIDSEPLFEHLYDALIAKRTQDVEFALGFADNPEQDAARLYSALDRAIGDAVPILTSRLELRAHTLLERSLYASAPDWYRSTNMTRRAELSLHLGEYNQARQRLLDLLGPVMNPQSLARHAWLERLSDELEIDDLEPERLHVVTRRHFTGVGHYEQRRDMLELALRGLHSGDESADSDFQKNTTLTYNHAPLPDAYKDLTPDWLAQQLATLQPRVDFAAAQNTIHALPDVRRAIEHMLDRRINALAYAAVLQGHLRDEDYRLIQRLCTGGDKQLSASALSLHGAVLQDLWVLREADTNGTIKRVLLCTPEAPRAQQFRGFDSERECQTHILAWADADQGTTASQSMSEYLITRAPLRFRNSLRQVLNSLSFKPEAQEYKKVELNTPGSHADCLTSMANHLLATRVDNYDFSTPLWYRSAPLATRIKLTTLAEDAEGALRTFNDDPASQANFPSFETYVHEQAKKRLNHLLNRSANDVDPDTVWAYSPIAVVGASTAQPQSYTQLFRDGYADGVGFLDEKFSRAAQFKGPPGIDLSALTAEKFARSITGVWIGERYIDKVKAELQDRQSAGYAHRRDATLAITQRQMQHAALECQLKGHISSIDLQWLEQSIASMGETASPTRTRYAIHRLMIDGEWVIDTWLFSHGDNPVLLYTPGAPDGISIRYARTFNYLLKQQPGMLQYLISRVSAQSQVKIRTFLEAAKSQLPADLDKSTASPALYDSIISVKPVSDLRLALYDMKLQRRIDDVYASTTNRTQMITGILWTCVEWVTTIATAPFPILSLSSGLLLAFKDAMLALHAYNQGDASTALEHFAGYLLNSAGALLTDLRPALRALPPIRRSTRLTTAGPEHVQAMKLIDRLEPARPNVADMQPVLFEGRALWAPKTPDAIGRYLLHRLDPDGKWLSTGRLAMLNTDGTMVRSGVSGGAPKYNAVPETSGPHKDYGMPPANWSMMELAMNPNFRTTLTAGAEEFPGSNSGIVNNAVERLSATRVIYRKQVERLTTDAQRYFSELAPLPSQVNLPAIDTGSSLTHLIDSNAFAGNKNLIIGAVTGSVASKQALIANMDALIEKGFKHLYVEFLPGDIFRLKIEKLNRGKSWRHIEQHLKAIDWSLGFAPNAEHSHLALVRKAREKGIKIHALDASTSYQLDDVLLLRQSSPTIAQPNPLRNFYSHKVIEGDFVDSPQERWIALVEQSRMRAHNGTPGLADLQNAVALRIEDVGPNTPVGISLDTPGAIAGDARAKGDYRMAIHTSYKSPEPMPSATVEPASSVQHFSDFDLEPSLRDEIARQSTGRHGLNPEYFMTDPASQHALNTFIDHRKHLKDAADSFFADYVPPARPALPDITASTTPQSFLKQVAESPVAGLVIGEGHAHQSSKALLIKQMKSFKEAGFKTIYVEHLLTDLHQAELDMFHLTQQLPEGLKNYLIRQDRGHMLSYSGPNTYSGVVQAAGKYGIRIRALDCLASYHLKGINNPDLSRNRMFSYFATRVIEADQAAQGPHKWIAFVGSAHTNNNLAVPGLTEMLGAVSLHVKDTHPRLSRGIHRGFWQIGPATDRSQALRGDFYLNVADAKIPAPEVFPPVDRTRLTQSGHFLLEQPSNAETNLIHRSGTGEIVSTPIQVDDKGLFFIDRWDKKEQRFEKLFTLIEMLKSDVGLRSAPSAT